MKKFEYDVTIHFVGLCSGEGQCVADQIGWEQVDIWKELLNKRGIEGWELVQLFFGKDGTVAFWKREHI